MSRTNAEIKAYSRGYTAGARNVWPMHKPPAPPNEIVAELLKTLQEIRDECDGFISTIERDDPLAVTLDRWIDKADASLTAVGFWLMEHEAKV